MNPWLSAIAGTLALAATIIILLMILHKAKQLRVDFVPVDEED